jgi:hypothetical protein
MNTDVPGRKDPASAAFPFSPSLPQATELTNPCSFSHGCALSVMEAAEGNNCYIGSSPQSNTDLLCDLR